MTSLLWDGLRSRLLGGKSIYIKLSLDGESAELSNKVVKAEKGYIVLREDNSAVLYDVVKKRSKVKILCVGDLHCGSKYAIKHPDFRKLNGTQRILFGKWKEMVKDVGSVDYLFIMGDTIDGINRDTEISDIGEQVNCAVKLLSMIKVKRDIFLVYGSGYHVEKDYIVDGDKLVAEKLGARKSGFNLNLEFEKGNVVNLGHAISGYGFNKTTGISKEILNALVNEKELGSEDIRVILRGHLHIYTSLNWKGKLAIITPAWKTRDSFAEKHGLNLAPDLGYVILTLENGEWDVDAKIFHIKAEKEVVKVES